MTNSNFDKVLHEAGEFGFYQKRLLVLVVITSSAVIMQNLSPVFTMIIPPHRCKIPGLTNDTYEVQNSQHAFLINMTIPVDDEGDYSKCIMYDATKADDISLHDKNRTTIPCEDWVFDHSAFRSTYVTELKLVCHNKEYRSHSTMMIFVGKFVGAFCNSAGGDYFGRRRVFLVMLSIVTATAIGLMFVSSLPVLMVLRFQAGATTTGIYLPMYVIAVELMGTSHRQRVGIAAKWAGVIAGCLDALFAFVLRDWRHFQACLAAPYILLLIGVYFVPESPRWLVSKGKLQEAQKLIDQIAKVNGVSEPPKLVSVATSPVDTSVEKVTPLQLFRIPRLSLRYGFLYCSWILVIMCLFGLSLNVSNMPGSFFLNNLIMSAMSIVAILVFTFLVERVGRRTLLLVSTMFGGLLCLSTIVPTVLGSNDWVLRSLSFAGNLFVSSGLSTLYVMSPELFPTVLRSFGLGSCSMMSRIGGLASPYVADLNTYVSGTFGPALPQIVFGVAGILTAIMVFFLPETRGRRLPETVQDAALFGRSRPEVVPSTEMMMTPVLKEQQHSASTEEREATVNGTLE